MAQGPVSCSLGAYLRLMHAWRGRCRRGAVPARGAVMHGTWWGLGEREVRAT